MSLGLLPSILQPPVKVPRQIPLPQVCAASEVLPESPWKENVFLLANYDRHDQLTVMGKGAW